MTSDMELLQLIWSLSRIFGINAMDFYIDNQFHLYDWFTTVARNFDDDSILILRETVRYERLRQIIKTELTIRGPIS